MNARLTPPMVNVSLRITSIRSRGKAGGAVFAGVTDGARSALVLWPGEGVAVSLLSNASWVSSIERSAMLLAAPACAQMQLPGAFNPAPAGSVAAPAEGAKPKKVIVVPGRLINVVL